MKVFTVAKYIGTTATQLAWRDDDYCAWTFVRALKGMQVKGYAELSVNGMTFRIDQATRDLAFTVFGKWCKPCVTSLDSERPYLVPVPNHNTLVDSPPPRTAKLAAALEAEGVGEMLDVLRFTEDLGSSSAGTGTRNAVELWASMTVVGEIPEGARCILVDDVFTTGAHLKASGATLTERHATVRGAIAAARVVHELHPHVFCVEAEELEDLPTRL